MPQHNQNPAVSGIAFEFAAKFLNCIPRDINVVLAQRLINKPKLMREAIKKALYSISDDNMSIDEIMEQIAKLEFMVHDRVIYYAKKAHDKSPGWYIELMNCMILEDWGNEFGAYETGHSPQEAILSLWRKLIASEAILVRKGKDEEAVYAVVRWDSTACAWKEVATYWSSKEAREIKSRFAEKGYVIKPGSGFVRLWW